MKRGVTTCAIHFQSPPYTGELALDKVLRLAKILGEYENGMRVYLVPFTKVQTEIHEKCPEGLGTLITLSLIHISTFSNILNQTKTD